MTIKYSEKYVTQSFFTKKKLSNFYEKNMSTHHLVI